MMNFGKNPQFLVLIYFLFVYTLVMKGIALWTAARNGQRNWFIFFIFTLLVNLLAIPEIIYLSFFAKEKFDFSSFLFWRRKSDPQKKTRN